MSSNADIAELLEQKTNNVYNSRLDAGDESGVHRGQRLNFLGGLLARNRKVHFFLKHMLLLTTQSKHKQLSAAVYFDNYTEQVSYSAAHNADTQGERLDMTNWAKRYVPAHVPPHFNLGRLGPP
eukprot:6206015-Pleurochrysis_carterae.AAC.8